MYTRWLGLGLALLLAVPGAENGNAAMENQLKNGSFEEQAKDKPAGWDTFTWQGEAAFEHIRKGRGGGRCVAISSDKGADAAWLIRVPVEPFAKYRIAGWIRTENVDPGTGRGALLNLHGIGPAQTRAVTGTSDWTRVAMEIETEDITEIQLQCLFGGWGVSTGRAWYDDLELVLLSRENADEVSTVRIDAAQHGAPISRYIYGQFIEHLGRCIYGGIWAEMLEDRKFFHAVDAEESPWRALGPGAVTMRREAPFVGEHTPCIAAPGGIAQRGLGVVRDKDYIGRVVLAGSPTAAPVAVTLRWGEAGGEQTALIDAITPEFTAYPVRFTAGASTDDARLEITAKGTGEVRIGAVSLMPADNVQGMRADTLALLKQLNAPVYRWPGGNFVSGYDWRDGIGERDRRPPRKNPAWSGVEHNDFGVDEFIAFCRILDTEPLIVVNSGLGDVQMAVEELQYVNGVADTPMGARRAANGHPEAYNVVWWGIGNEMYGNWQLGHMPLEDYVKKHKAFADAMRAEDPRIKLIAVGATGQWSETMLAECADHMDLLSEHFYCGEAPGLIAHVRQIASNVRNKVHHHKQYHENIPALAGRKIPICMDEWNYWYGDHKYGELGTAYFLKDALGIAAGLHEYFRHSEWIYMANYAQTVNVIGCIKTSKTAAAFDTTGLVLMLYRREFGEIPVAVAGGPRAADIMAAWTADRTALTIGVVNPFSAPLSLDLDLAGAALSGAGVDWTITGPDPMAHNAPGEEPLVTIAEEKIAAFGGALTAPPLSIRLYRLNAAPQ